MSDPQADICLSVITTAPALGPLAAELSKGSRGAAKPILQVMQPGALADAPRKVLREAGEPFTDSVHEAIGAIRAWREWSSWQESASDDAPGVQVEVPAGAAELSEEASKSLLQGAGIDVVQGVVVRDVEEAAVAAKRLGFPLVVKIVSPQIVHKTEVGGVALNLRSESELRDALDAMRTRVAAAAPHAQIEGFFLQRMATGTVELLVGARRDPQFGPVVIVGSGGVLVELLKDIVLLPLPVSREDARRALTSLRIAPLLEGFRGSEPVDMDAAIDVVLRFAAIGRQLAGRDFELEANPVKAGPDGCVAVDARARLGAKEEA